MIQLQNVTKKYGNEFALKDVSLTLEKGKIYGLVGPNGSGKSTTLRMIAGLVYPTSGVVTVNGKIVDRKIANEVAYLSELDINYQSFSAQNFIDFYATQFADFNIQKAEELLSFMKLDRHKKWKKLSKGNRGRLKLVLALARETSVLLLDEPLSGLDPMVRESIVKGLLSFIDFEKQVVVIATHEINEIESLFDEVIAIQDGAIVEKVNVEELREEQGLSVLEWMKKIYQL